MVAEKLTFFIRGYDTDLALTYDKCTLFSRSYHQKMAIEFSMIVLDPNMIPYLNANIIWYVVFHICDFDNQCVLHEKGQQSQNKLHLTY